MEFTVLTGGTESAAEFVADGDRVRAPIGQPLFGWERKPHGWCRGDACVPAFRAAEVEDDHGVDVLAFAELTGSVAAADMEHGVVALADGPEAHARGGEAPDFPLTDGRSLSDLRGRKVAVVFWASWCGCRYDLGAWQERHDALEEHGFSVVSVALDRNAADAGRWLDEAKVTHPAAIDTDGAIAERYNVINVPTVVWIDEEGRIARPQDTQTATDLFRSMNGLDSQASLDALRRWVIDGDAGLSEEEVRRHWRSPSGDEQMARAEARVAVWLARHGHREAALRHRERAAALAPHDVAIRRGLMPLTGEDPFGEEYFALREELEGAGIPVYRPLPDWHNATEEAR